MMNILTFALLCVLQFTPGTGLLDCCFPLKKDTCCKHMEGFDGAKVFFTLKLSKMPWTPVLIDHYSIGYRDVSENFIKETKFLGPTPESKYKIVGYERIDGNVLVKVMLTIPGVDVLNQLPHSLMIDINNDISFGLLGGGLDVDPSSLIYHDIMMSNDSVCCVKNYEELHPKPKKKWQEELENEAKERYEQMRGTATAQTRYKCNGTQHRFMLRFPNTAWDPNYDDPNSDAFQQLQDDINRGGDNIHLEGPEFVGFDVISISKDPDQGIQVKIQNKLVVTVDQGSDNFVYRALAHFVTLTDHCLKQQTIGGHVCDRALFIAMEEATGKGGTFYVDELRPEWESNCVDDGMSLLEEGDQPAFDECCRSQFESICCPEPCCHPKSNPGGCCKSGEDEDTKGIKLFVSFLLTNQPWTVALLDPHSTGFRELTLKIHKQMYFLYPVPDTRLKVIQFTKEANDEIKAKMLVWVPKVERGPLYVKAFIDSMRNDVKGGKMGRILGVKDGSVVVYHQETDTFCCHHMNELSEGGCCKDECCRNGFAKVPCCPREEEEEEMEGNVEDVANQQTISDPYKICSGMILRFSFRLKDKTWSDALADQESDEFKAFAKDFEKGFLPLFELSPTVAGVHIVGLRESPGGGVFVKFHVNMVILAEYVPQTFVIDAITAWMVVVEAAMSGNVGALGAVDSLVFIHVRAAPTVMFRVKKRLTKALSDQFCLIEDEKRDKYIRKADQACNVKYLLF